MNIQELKQRIMNLPSSVHVVFITEEEAQGLLEDLKKIFYTEFNIEDQNGISWNRESRLIKLLLRLGLLSYDGVSIEIREPKTKSKGENNGKGPTK